ncbi:TonB-dependent receptor plug domain-containing protein [Niabella sp. W65]|nr:TonB-dependent receptor plug domain-containing protein [Niabella sp. W65]MCH7363396.1 TonB-dependent receptor plug domain-containing protein [Niabella sp. W65]
MVSNSKGEFTISVSKADATLIISHVTHATKKVPLTGVFKDLIVTLDGNQTSLDDVVVIGYGKTTKEGNVAAVSQTGFKELERAGGVTSLGAAMTGNLPGLITAQGTGTPGEEDPRFIIRGVSSLNGSDPLVLVDGVERTIANLDIASVETVTVLKTHPLPRYSVHGALMV